MTAIDQAKNPLIYAVTLLVLVNVARIQELFTFLIPFRLGLIANLFGILLLISVKKIPQKISLMQIPQVKLMLAIYGLCLFSIPFSVFPGQSFSFSAVALPKTLFLFFLVIYAVNSYADLEKVFWAYFAGVFLMAMFTIYSKGSGRLTVTATYDPNDMAAVCVMTLPLIYFHINHLKGKRRLVLLGLLLTLLFTLVLTVSRGGFIGLLTVTVLIMFMDSYKSWKVKAAVVGILAFAFLSFTPESYWHRMDTITSQQDYNYTSKYGRKALWERGFNLMLENPLTGVGAGAIVTGVGQSYGPQGGAWMTVHNSFVQIGAELGVGGLMLYIALLFFSIRGLHQLGIMQRQTKDRPMKYAWLATALEISLISFCVVGFFLSWAYQPLILFLIALSGGIKKLEFMKNEAASEEQDSASSERGKVH